MKRESTSFAVLAILAAAGCAEPAAGPLSPGDVPEPSLDLAPAVHVLNTQLRGIIDPDIQPTPAWGHVQVKLTDAGDSGYRVEWRGKLFNPDGQVFSSASIFYGGPDALPTDPVLFTFFRASDASCPILSFNSQGLEEYISADFAQDMIINPEIHVIRLTSTDGSVVEGRFGGADPTELVGFNPQPDPPGRVRCEVEAAG